MDPHLEVVRLALALHLREDLAHLELHHHLARELGIDALDLVLVALRLEDIEKAEFPVADLETVETVGDLVAIVRRWSSADRAATLPPPPPSPPARTRSGFHAVTTPTPPEQLVPMRAVGRRNSTS